MNTNGLAKQYEKLTPWERLPLLAAAWARGDEAESDHLARSAPRESFRLPDYHGLAEGLLLVSLLHLVELLRFTALFWHTQWLSDQSAWLKPRGAEQVDEDGSLAAVCVGAYLLVCHFDGWRLFCKERNLDPEVLLRDIPGYGVAIEAEAIARALAFNAQEAAAWVRRDGTAERAEILTAESVAADLRKFVEKRAQW
jgi:hypothetical protein